MSEGRNCKLGLRVRDTSSQTYQRETHNSGERMTLSNNIELAPADPERDGLESILNRYVPRFQDRTVLVLGDVILDRYISGDVRRISPEAPIPVMKRQTEYVVPGGAANVANNIAALGGRAILLSAIGDDEAGRQLIGALNLQSCRIVSRLYPSPSRVTTVKTRYISGSHQLLRVDEEDDSAVENSVAEWLLAQYEELLPDVDVVILSDYAKGVLSGIVLTRSISLAVKAKRKIVADPKRNSFADYSGVDVLTPNVVEIGLATGISATDDTGAENAGKAALQTAKASAVLITRSERGFTLVTREGFTKHVPTRASEVADVSGAGDTFIATFSMMLACGADITQSASIANVGAGIAVAKQGTATVTQTELASALRCREVVALDAKIAAPAEATEIISTWRRQNLLVGFISGSFDLRNPDELLLLNQAHSRCDRLVVGLESNRALIQPDEPMWPTKDEILRPIMLASIAACDLVVPFNESTVETLAAALRPDLIFVSTDRSGRTSDSEKALEANSRIISLDGNLYDKSIQKFASVQMNVAMSGIQ